MDRMLSRFVGELLEAAHVPASLDEAAQAEAWASGAVAEWEDLGGDPAVLAGLIDDAEPFAAAMIDWVVGADVPTLGPEWIDDVGAHEVTGAAELLDGGERALILEFTAPSGAAHDLSVTLADGVVVDCSVGPPGLAAAAAEDEIAGLEVQPVDRAGAEAEVREALRSVEPSELTVNGRLNLPLLFRRFAIAAVAATSDAEVRDRVPTAPERDPEDDRWAADLVRSALRLHDLDVGEATEWSTIDASPELIATHERFVTAVESGDADAGTLVEVAGLERVDRPVDHLRAVAAYLTPADLSAHPGAVRRELLALEWADWSGAVLGLARSSGAVEVDGPILVTLINRCPEITTTIPKNDAERVAWSFEQTLYAWVVTGVLDDEARLTDVGRWLLPRSAIVAWEWAAGQPVG